jgi:hypothetical protein
MKITRRNTVIALIAITTFCLVFVGTLKVIQIRQYAVIEDYVAVHQSEIGMVSSKSRTTTACKTDENTGATCRAIEYKLTADQCKQIGQALFNSPNCNNVKILEFEGHTLRMRIGDAYPGSGLVLSIAFVK